MNIIDCGFFREALHFIDLGAGFGWHERNAGNISLRLSADEATAVADCFSRNGSWVRLTTKAPEMAGEYVFTTATGSYFTDIKYSPETKFCLCEISPSGDSYRILWGAEKPTSELCGHLLSLGELKKRNGGNAVYHCHPANIVALTYLLPQTDAAMTNALWKSETECAFVFPEGVGVVGFNVPGSIELALATKEKMKIYNAVVWSFHGVFASGEDIRSAFGLAHAIEKAAEVRIKVISSGNAEVNTISNEELIKTAQTYGKCLNTSLLCDEVRKERLG